jgi:hypothetical protein
MAVDHTRGAARPEVTNRSGFVVEARSIAQLDSLRTSIARDVANTVISK